MTDGKDNDHGSSGGPAPSAGRGKRPGPTIDLEAAHVSTTSSAESSSNSSASAAASDAKPSEEKSSPSGAKADQVKSPNQTGFGASATSVPGSASGPSGKAAEPAASPAGDNTSGPGMPPQPEPRSLASSILAGGISGAAMGAAVIVVAISMGWPQTTAAPEAQPAEVRLTDLEALKARIATIETRPAPLAAAPASPVPNPAPDPAIDEKLAGLDQRLSALNSEATKTREDLTRSAATIDTLKAALGAPAPTVDLSAVNARLASIERAATALRGEVSESRNSPRDDLPLRRVLAATLLEVAVRQGEPFADMLAAARPLAPDASTLKPLETFAASGVPGRGTLIRELQAQLPKLTPSQPVAADAPLLDRLQASAMRLVRVQRTDANDASGHPVVADKIANALRQGDLNAARAGLNDLSLADRTLVTGWIERFDARQAAIAASHRFATESMTALIPPAGR